MPRPGTPAVQPTQAARSSKSVKVALIDAADQLLLYGRMPQTMRQSLANG
jgi:hypothetical protein